MYNLVGSFVELHGNAILSFTATILDAVMRDVYHISHTVNGETGLHYRHADAISSQVQRYYIIVADREREKF